MTKHRHRLQVGSSSGSWVELQQRHHKTSSVIVGGCDILSSPDPSVLPTGSVICETTGGVHVSVLWKESEGKQ